MTDWSPIDTAPKDKDIQIHLASGYITRGRLINGKYLAIDSPGPMGPNTDTTATHWAPISEPPSGKE